MEKVNRVLTAQVMEVLIAQNRSLVHGLLLLLDYAHFALNYLLLPGLLGTRAD